MSVAGAGGLTFGAIWTFLLATWPRRIIGALALVTPIVIYVLGGFAAVDTTDRAVAHVGEPRPLGALSVTPVGFFVSDNVRASELEYIDGADGYIGILAHVENEWTAEVPLAFPGPASMALMPVLPDELVPDVGSVSVPDQVLRVADGTPQLQAVPGLTHYVAMLWPVTDIDAVTGDTLAAVMNEQRYMRNVLFADNAWVQTDIYWDVELPRLVVPEILLDPPEEEITW